MIKRICRVAWCGRSTPERSSFCARCARHVHPATWLQINDLHAEYDKASAAGEDLQRFLAYCWRVAIAYACDEARHETDNRYSPAYAPWSSPPDSPWRHDPEKIT